VKKLRPTDLAREFNKKVQQAMFARTGPLPLAGIQQDACERNIYLRLNSKETPDRQFRTVLAYWKELLQKHGDAITGIGNMRSLIVTPTGETFCNLRMARFPSRVGETEADTNPVVEQSVRLFLDFAEKAGRVTATIQNEALFVCSDGRRWSLAECECCNSMTEELSRTFKSRI
jgi:hypothetical protein